jgi:type II secretory pathway predicted ATPase ExeA
MYETYFNLKERPFTAVPRPDHYFPATAVEAARTTLVRCIERGEGVALIIGPSGTGKSMLCGVLAERFKSQFQVALLTGGHLDTRRALLQAVLHELHQPYRGMDEGELRLALVDHATLDEAGGRGILLLVDEAHHLPLKLLDEIRTMTNLMRKHQPAVRLVLAGNHALEERFASPKLESLSQRVSARCYLEPFGQSETVAYIHRRFVMSGGHGAEIFPVEACQTVHKATDGVPRLVNQICDHALLMAQSAGLRQIAPAQIEAAWADLQQLPAPWSETSRAPTTAVVEFGQLDEDPVVAETVKEPAAVRTIDESFRKPSSTFQAAALTRPELARPRFRLADLPDDDGCEDVSAAGRAPSSLIANSQSPIPDPEPTANLDQIQQLLSDVQREFRPRIAAPESIRTQVAAVEDVVHPFHEDFAEEEVIADRYAGMELPRMMPSQAAIIVDAHAKPQTAMPAQIAAAPHVTTPYADTMSFLAASMASMTTTTWAFTNIVPEPSAAIPSQASLAPAQAVERSEIIEHDAIYEEMAATLENLEQKPPRPSRPAVPPPRGAFGQLFGKLRKAT